MMQAELWRRALCIAAMACVLAAGLPARAAGKGPAKLEDVKIYLILKDDTKLIGDLADYNRERIVVREQGTGKLVAVGWDQFKPYGCYFLQKRLTNPNSAEVNFRLGAYCFANDLRDLAYEHFDTARRLDPSYAGKIKDLVTGRLRGVPLAIGLINADELAELERREAGDEQRTEVQTRRPDTVVKYQKFTPEQQAYALRQIRLFGDKVNEKMGTKLVPVETAHFVIFTDWPATLHNGASQMFERIYERLCEQFDIPADENIFLGKMPIFAFDNGDEYQKFMKDVDQVAAIAGSIAYVRANGDGYEHMNLYRYGNALLLEKTVTHEMVHAFSNRYRSNIPLEGWLNEGLAEVMSGALVPRSRTMERARYIAKTQLERGKIDYEKFMHGYSSPAGGYYPICTVMVEYLLRKDSHKFLEMIESIKKGTATEAALRGVFNIDYRELTAKVEAWVKADFPKV
ncbi:MAG: hypothetical protein BIFFINMI_01886 [Phycisphaerae bacterium]|nr:hypothetical protein [Phycisphaerae bacterium]